MLPSIDRELLHRRACFAAIILLTVTLTAACSGHRGHGKDERSATTPTIPAIDAATRLDALGRAWARTPATIIYRTVAPIPGQPASTHQCLRQLVTSIEDRAEALRRCSRQGRLTLTWDPPEGWQMDVTSPIERFRIVSTADSSLLCRTSADPNASCRSISSRRARAASPFGFLLMAPSEILALVGAPRDTVQASPATDLIGEHLECFHAAGPAEDVGWCFSRDGLLLSFLRGSAAGGWTSIEATSISR